MKKKCNVIQINGISGIFLALFLLGCGVTGFVVFPGWCCMHLWNYIAQFVSLPIMSILHGIVLWAIIALIFFATHINKQPIKVGSFSRFGKDDLKKTIESLKIKNMSDFKNNDNNENDNPDNISKEN